MSNEFYTVFPASRAVDDFPPIAYHIHQGHRVPAYRLGWVVTVTEAEELLGPAPEGRDVINYYSYDILPSRWGTTQAKSDLQPPDLMLWRYETGQHKEELITRSIEAIGLTSEMREKNMLRFVGSKLQASANLPFKSLLNPKGKSDEDSGITYVGRFSAVLPVSRDIDDFPPIVCRIHQGHRVPGYFLGWVVTVTEAEKLLGPAPEDEDTIEYYNFQLLPSRWEKTKAKSTEDLKMVNEHKEELITRSIEAFGFTSERQEKVKWYRLK
ncbi:hypothetical protein EV359DRAFT_67957 [Lentinula novae-zelandiae]|nr:hypothetical protein EV359DRAFT_67957 [Lentinula novae-zelandiae]